MRELIGRYQRRRQAWIAAVRRADVTLLDKMAKVCCVLVNMWPRVAGKAGKMLLLNTVKVLSCICRDSKLQNAIVGDII